MCVLSLHVFRVAVAAILLGSTLACPPAVAREGQASPDYGDGRFWLCRPDLRQNRCRTNLDATVIPASGETSIEAYAPADDPPIDCFYIYPTVSRDPTWQSDLEPDDAEWSTVRQQFARFGQACRQFAPLYRQGTLRRLRAPGGGPAPIGEMPAPGVGGYADVAAAWNWYLAHGNHGRGVVLIGHSQGGAMITRLVAEQIDGRPLQARFVSALILGAPVMVPDGSDVGGSFRTIPLCRSAGQTGCVISYATYRDNVPPPSDARFGRARDGLRVACVNPARLEGGPGRPRPYFLTRGFLNGSGGQVQPDWLAPARRITTDFVTTPGLVTTACMRRGDFDYLSLSVNADPDDPRTDDLAGHIVRATGPDYSWGLHLIDVDHAIGTLVDTVQEQGRAYIASQAAESAR